LWLLFAGASLAPLLHAHQAGVLSDAFERFSKAGVKVFGISGDPPSELKNFAQKENLQVHTFRPCVSLD
jgi:hypothetical protein